MYRNTSKVTLKEIRHFVRYFRVIHLVRKLHKQKKDYSTTSRVFTLEHTCSSVIFLAQTQWTVFGASAQCPGKALGFASPFAFGFLLD